MEEELIKRAKRKDKEAFEKLIEPYIKSLYVTARTIMGNETDAEDVVQETLLDAYTNLWLLRKEKSFKSWLFKILNNNCTNVFRDNRSEIIPFTEQIIDKLQSTDIKRDLDFFESIDFLDKNDKTILAMKYLFNFKIVEISKFLKLSESAVKMRISRAKEKIKNQYRKK